MLSVSAALEIVLQQARPLLPVTASLSAKTVGLLLAEDVASDVDMPPFDKAMMDGYALRSADVIDGKAELTIVEEITAGKVPTLPIHAGQAARIMTGAPIPHGVDAVVMVERSESIIPNRVRIQEPKTRPGLNILAQGREMRAGEIVLHAGAQLRPQEFGLLAAVGRTSVKVQPAPRVAILPTGDELVEPQMKPAAGQIRNSNGPMLLAQVCRAGAEPQLLGIARDEPAHLRGMIETGLQADVLLLSGGVSAGKLDLVPGILADLGVVAMFHKVEMKPGKPVLFGIKATTHGSPPRLVFGLPGNPVSTMVCFELFVRPALRALMGLPPGPDWQQATLLKEFPYRTDRPTYHPARVQMTATGWSVEIGPWFGSPDLRGVLAANAFVHLPAGDHVHRAGQKLDILGL